MQFVTTTPLAFAIALGIMLLGPIRGLWLVFLTMPFGAGAAFGLSGLGTLSLTDFAIVVVWISLVGRAILPEHLAGTLRPGQPGFPLLLLVILAIMSAIFSPRIFTGATEVFVVIRNYAGSAIDLAPLQPTGSNINQLVLFLLAASAFLLFATGFRLQPSPARIRTALVGATVVHVVLTVLDLASYAVGLPDLLDPIRTMRMAMLDNQVLLGLKRLAGGFPEPSSFSFYTIGLYGVWLRLWFGEHRQRGDGLLLLVILILLIRSTSSAAYVALVGFSGLFFMWNTMESLRRERAMWIYGCFLILIPLVFGALVMAWNLVPALSDIVDRTLFSKLDSSSGVERMDWNLQAVQNMIDTLGLGAGIGSVRASGLLFALLGNLGLVGAALFIWFSIAALGMRPAPVPVAPGDTARRARLEMASALQCGCVATLILSLLTTSFPNLGVPFFAMAGLAVGLLRYDQLSHHRGQVFRARKTRAGAAAGRRIAVERL